MNLIGRSIELILNHQHGSGAYIASPNFSQYQYAWFRDGAYIAYAADLYGYHASAERFHDWCANVVERYRGKITRAMREPTLVLSNNREAAFHCRFTLQGEEVISGWSTHQLDGLGTWLWSLVEHCKLRGIDAIPSRWRPALDLGTRYIEALWKLPCADCWEENEDQIHTYTLAALAGGLHAYLEFAQNNHGRDEVDRIKQFIHEHCLAPKGYYKKSVNLELVDANLLGLVFPFAIVPIDSPGFMQTLEKIEEDLRVPGGGLMRYAGDHYYGGGEWILLTAWLGCIYAASGEIEKALEVEKWVEAQADPDGALPEQVLDHAQSESYQRLWLQKWGPVATPLLWAHAKYLILCHAIANVRCVE